MTISPELRLAIAVQYSEEAQTAWLACQLNDWDALATEAVEQRLAPLLYHSLQMIPRSDVPDRTMQRLREVYLATGTRNMWMLHQFKRVTDVLDVEGIRWIPLKGAALIDEVYEGNMALRPMSDVDLMVDLVDFRKAHSALSPHVEVAPLLVDDVDGISQHAHTIYPAPDVSVELHTRLVRYAHFIDRPTFKQVAPEVKMLPEWQFLHLCAHAFYHHQHDVPHFGADAAFVCQSGFIWDDVLRYAQAHDMVLALQWGVGQLVENWFADISLDVQALVSELRPSFAEKFYTFCVMRPALRRVGTWVAMPTWRLKGRYVLAVLFPSKAWLEHRWNSGNNSSRIKLYQKRIAAITDRLC